MKKKLNIFFSNSISKHKWGGGEKWMVTAAKGLSKRGHNVYISGKANSILLEKAIGENLNTVPLNIYADYNPFKILHTKKILQKLNIDAIVLNLNKDIRVAGIAARWAKVPAIIARNGLQLFSDKWKYKMTIGLVDGIITNSKSIKEAYEEFPWMEPDKTVVIYNGISTSEYNIDDIDINALWSIPKKNNIFVAAGRLTTQKGFDLLIKAASKIDYKKYPFTILIAGKGKDRKYLSKLINELKMGDRVHLIGFQNKLSQFLKSCDFVIMPSRQEGMPNVVMESMALGKPVLAANVNGVPELIEHEISGYIFEPYKIDAIRNAMNYVMKNKDSSIIKNWGLKAQDHVKKNFTIDIMLDNLESYFYEKINNSIRK